MPPTKLAAGAPFPPISWPAVGGARVDPSARSGWQVLIVYRGQHCPLCKGYLKDLGKALPKFAEAGVAVSALSADPKAKAEADVAKFGWAFPVGYDLAPEEMRTLGLYISEPLSDRETDRPFAEPGLFVINPAGLTQIIDISNAPFARPDIGSLLHGLQFVIARDYPIRGRA
jgi:peroxiredoxin